MARARRRSRKTARKKRGAGVLRLALMVGGLVAMNVYVFFYKGGTSIDDVKRAVKEARVGGADASQFSWRSFIQAEPEKPGANPQVLRGRLRERESVGTLLARLEIPAKDADGAMRALDGVLDWRRVKAGVPYRVARGADGALVSLELTPMADEHVIVDRDADGRLVGRSSKSK